MGNCLDCRYFVADSDSTESGFCHRFPPVSTNAPTQEFGKELAFHVVYPRIRTHHENWCGEWKTIPAL
jgi:hypothetical protein